MVVLRPQGGGITLVVFVSIFIPLCITSTCLRIWARRIKRKQLEINDYAVIVATVLAVTNACLTLSAVVNGGVGQHQQDVLPVMQTLLKITLALALVWTLANTAVKISILHLYISIFRVRHFRWASYAVMVLTGGYAITNILQNLLICRPLAYNWDKTIDGTCASVDDPYLASACINMGIDVIIIILPMPMLWSLQLPTRKKVALTAIFGMGTLICVLSAIRIKSIVDLDLLDFSYSVVPDGVYSVLEPCLGVINASLPVLQPVTEKLATSKLFSRLRGSLMSSSRNQQPKKASDWSAPHSESSEPGAFHRLDDQRSTDDHVPLTEVVVTPNRAIRKTTDLEVVKSLPGGSL